MAQIAQFPGLLLIVARVGTQFVLQAFDGLIVGVQRFDFIQQLLVQCRNFSRLNAVLARQGVDGVQTLLDLLQSRRVRLETVEKPVDFTDRFLDLNLASCSRWSGD